VPESATVGIWLVGFNILRDKVAVYTIKQIAVFLSDWCGKIEHTYTLYISADSILGA